MGNDNQFVEQPVPAFVNPTTASSSTTRKDGIVALETPIEPIDSRRTLLDEKINAKKNRRFISSSAISADKIFAFALFILLIILITYILFHGKFTDVKLSRLTNGADRRSDDTRQLLEDMNQTLKSIERLLIAQQTGKTNVNIQLNGQDIREFQTNGTKFNEFLRRLKEQI